MACAEQPLKKRRLCETIPESQPPPPQIESPSTSPQGLRSGDAAASLSERNSNQNQKQRRRDCMSAISVSNLVLVREIGTRFATLEQADLVPRYAPYCPTAISDAVQSVIDDVDGVAFQTAKAFSLVDLCSAASSNRASSSGARDISVLLRSLRK
ncbi:hypothetical protein Bca4012_056209 [Brassica carinata]|uniref:Uncharacterized protein n=1 Tax=Brassica carinata TaxID=52824 RepID=A0A8X8B2Z5_BRACI|nr:hypothetical protein Bca52824_013968 [Brassica carinata]